MNMAVNPNVPIDPGLGARLTAVRAPRVGKLEVGVLELIEWAFQRERVGLDFNEIEKETGARPGVGVEYLMMEQAKLGCRVQGGGSSPRHHDADMVAAALASMPEGQGGRRMAIEIAELARVGGRPDWMRGARIACEPVAWRASKHGRYAHREQCRQIGQRWPAHQVTGRDDGFWCPVSYSNSARDVAAARRRYLGWYGALLHLRHVLQVACPLTSFVVTDRLPDRAPWKSVLT